MCRSEKVIQKVPFTCISKGPAIVSTTPPKWAARARSKMKTSGITQQDLIRVLGVQTRGAVGHYFTGRRKINDDQAVALARYLGVTMDQLFADSDEIAHGDETVLSGASLDQLIDQLATKLRLSDGSQVSGDRIFLLKAALESLEDAAKAKFNGAKHD